MRKLLIGGMAWVFLAACPAGWAEEVERVVLIAEVGRLQAEVEDLGRRLREAEEALEAIRSGDSEQVGLPVAVAAAGEDEAVRVIAVDRELDIVALSGGSRQHLRAGMNGALVRDGRVIARIRLVDVRRDVSGAVVTRRWSGVDPEPGDRWLLGR